MTIADLGLSEFISSVEAIRDGETWTICCDPNHNPPRGMIYGCVGDNEFEAKEDAYIYLQCLMAELNS